MPKQHIQNARVHFGLKAEDVPPHPGHEWTRFVCISDTHSKIYPVPDGDVLLHAGDICGRGRLADMQKMFGWLQTLPHPNKV